MKARRKSEGSGSLASASTDAFSGTQSSKGRLLVIEDEPDLQELLRYNLSREGFEVLCTDRGERGLELVRKHLPDLVVLDLMLPGMDGLEVCRALRGEPSTASIPVVMVTAKDQEADIVLGLELGADDYITKPYRWRELLARIRAVLRRRSTAGSEDADKDSAIRVRNLVIDPQRHQVMVKEQLVDLTVTEFRILRLLAARPGRVFTRQQIIEAVHGDLAAVTDRSVDVQVVALRRKLSMASDDASGDDIETIRGVGYRFKE
jgi:two-component system phosphate regulon response regulator PhoB